MGVEPFPPAFLAAFDDDELDHIGQMTQDNDCTDLQALMQLGLMPKLNAYLNAQKATTCQSLAHSTKVEPKPVSLPVQDTNPFLGAL